MIRVLLVAVALAGLPVASRAAETVVRLKVRSMPAPKPALKYLLLPEVRELNSGNPAQYYFRCFAEQRNFFFSKEGVAQRESYLSMPLAELSAKKLRGYGGSALTQADWAARLDTLDWQMVQRIQTEGMDLRLPELGPLRILAKALKARFRIEVAGRHFDDAIRTAKTMFALARHLGECPTETANLLGLSVANLALDALEEMLGQSGCPNLYWAFTDLPSPLVDLRKGMQGHSSLVATDLRLLRDDAPMTEEQLEKLVSRLSGLMGYARVQAGRPPRSLRGALAARVKDSERVRDARDRLFAARCAALIERSGGEQTLPAAFDRVLKANVVKDQIQQFPALQVILLDEKREHEIRRDEELKLLTLAPWQIDALGGEVRERQGDGLFADFLPHVIKVRREQARLEQRIALLRHVEALRLYAAEHDNTLPAKLSDISVPLPADPFTGKPFVYTVEAATAHFRGNSPRGEEKNPAHHIRYEVVFQK